MTRRVKVYNKLVRDKIPGIISDSGKVPVTLMLPGHSYLTALNNKLQEELEEYYEDFNIGELADIQEVIDSILEFHKVSKEQFKEIQDIKRAERGSFKNRIFLQSVEG